MGAEMTCFAAVGSRTTILIDFGMPCSQLSLQLFHGVRCLGLGGMQSLLMISGRADRPERTAISELMPICGRQFGGVPIPRAT